MPTMLPILTCRIKRRLPSLAPVFLTALALNAMSFSVAFFACSRLSIALKALAAFLSSLDISARS